MQSQARKSGEYDDTEQTDRIDYPLSRLRGFIRSGKYPFRRLSIHRRLRLINTALVSREAAGERNGKPFPLHENRFVSGSVYFSALADYFRQKISVAACDDLKSSNPDSSAFKLLNLRQSILLAVLIICGGIGIAASPLHTAIALNVIATIYFLCAILYRAFLIAAGPAQSAKSSAPFSVTEKELPVITILLPLYRDEQSLPMLAEAINALRYPPQKKDVILLLEADDTATLAEARRLRLHERYNILVIPDGRPRTKPKACNFGMHMARGDLIVIYDAEDQPEADQLLCAAAAFSQSDETVACVQAKLNFDNRYDNWLTRLFTLEYSLWFDWLLPALQKLNAPIPLGGTSNFFRTDILIELGGWDAFNVTEDADLGLRLSRYGYKTTIIDSTTYEEANCSVSNWIRQRSRWLKGYLQTWLVHMRHPGEIIRTTGWSGFLSVQLFLAGNVFSALINPVLWTLFVLWLLARPSVISDLFPSPLLELNIGALIVGNLFFVALMVIAPLRRGWWRLSIYGLTAPAYWLLTSIAGYKAIWQLITRPHYWEKTDHMLSAHTQQKRRDALARSGDAEI